MAAPVLADAGARGDGRTDAPPTFTAAVRERFGPPSEVVELRQLERLEPGADEVLVRVRAASLNIADWYGVVGRPWIGRPALGLRRPKELRLGLDYAGVVEAVGANVTDFRPGDEVFGGRTGAWAEYVAARADRAIVPKPASVGFEEAAAVPTAAITALQAIRDHGGLEAGQRVLVDGASGGVGTFAVQIAKALGGEVTAVCSTANVEIARSLGADRVVDYTREDVTRSDERFHLVVDVAGTTPFARLRRVLERDATVVLVGGPRANRLFGPLGHVVRTRVSALRAPQTATFFIAQLTKADLLVLHDLVESRRLRPVLDRVFPFAELCAALEHMGHGHPRGKIVLTM